MNPTPVRLSDTAARPILAVGSAKGGTGKSTLALALGHALALRGRAVTLLDLDPQAGLTDYAGHHPADDPLHADPVLAHGMTLYRSGRALAHASDGELSRHIARAISGGVVVADLSPALADGAHRVLLARPDVQLLAAVRLDAGGMRAAGELTALANLRGVPFRIVPTFWKKLSVAQVALNWMAGTFDGHVLDPIPEDVRAMEAPLNRKPVTLSAPNSRASQAFGRIADALLEGGL